MPQTYKSYPVVEVGLQAYDYADDPGGERFKEGDIVDVRLPVGQIGLKERASRLWIYIYGPDLSFWRHKSSGLYSGSIDESIAGLDRYEKRRYCIPFTRLSALRPGWDLARIRDPFDNYQPGLVLDEDDLTIIIQDNPIQASGNIYDKVTRTFI